jgi:ABC-type oligopeptide transport system substrate-binding subunit
LTRRHHLVAIALVGVIAAIAAATASAGNAAKSGGTINIDLRNDVDYTDPALSYYAPGWELEFATQLKLVNYPDAAGPRSSQLTPEAAAGFPKISSNGKVYDFTVNANFTKFSDGKAVTAANFKAAFDRIADPKMQSPAQAFMSDIVGSDKTPVSGVRVRGNHLVVTLKKAAPDFLARMAMPFFSAIPTNLAHDPNGVETPASAGPYYVASRTANKSIIVKKNPYYKGKRPHNVNQFVYTVGNSLEAIRLRVEQGESDYAADGIPPSAYAEVAGKYGVNKGRFFVKPILAVNYLAMNMSRPIFQNNVNLRRAINYAIDRKAMLSQSGFLAGKRTDQILPPGLAGFRDASLYPIKGPDLATAKKYANGHTKDGKVVVYTCNSGSCPLRAQILQFNLQQIGLDVEVKQFTRAVQIQKEGTRGEPFDIADEGWIADYADPYDFINVLLDGRNIQASNNNNYSYFNDPKYNQKMTAASLLSGAKRNSTYGALDIDLMQNAIPWAPRANSNDRIFVSGNFGCFTYNNIYGNDLAASCVK